ncbi:MAG: gluconate 2-dehydrogenase subunit 3 family protein, partial [Myxococcota bacterium]
GGAVKLTRRRVLVGGAALAAGSAVLFVPGVTAPGARILTIAQLRIVTAIAEVMFPGAPFPVNGIEAGVPAEVDRIVADVLEPLHATAFCTLLQTLEWGTLASRGSKFSSLPAAEREDVLVRWLDPSVFTRRLAAETFRIVLGMAYFANPVVLGHMGWRAECGGRAS